MTRRPASLAARRKSGLPLVEEVRALILSARADRLDSGQRVVDHAALADRHPDCRDILREKRAGYGEEIRQTLSAQLSREFGRGFGEKNLHRMIQFAELFPDEEIVATLSRQLGRSHFIELLPVDKPHARDFYAEMCRLERWSVRTLRRQIDGMLYERTRSPRSRPS